MGNKILMNYGDYNHLPQRAIVNGYGGVGYYRIIKPSQNIRGHQIDVIGKEIGHRWGDKPVKQWEGIFTDYDIFWCTHFSDAAAGSLMYYHRNELKKKVVIDIDDNYLDLPESNKEFTKFRSGKSSRSFLSTILYFADVITVSTDPLKQRLFEHFKNIDRVEKKIFVVPNLNDINDWNYESAEKHKDRIVIGYSGSNSHNDDIEMILPALKRVMEKYPHVWFEGIGIMTSSEAFKMFRKYNFSKSLADRIQLISPSATFKEYPEWLSSMKWDIGIAPLVDTAFTRSKSCIKWMEYSMFKIPVVASRVYPYFMDIKGRRTIEEGKTGLLCRPQEWEQKLSMLIEDEELRKTLGNNAYEHIKKNWQYKDDDSAQQVADYLSIPGQ